MIRRPPRSTLFPTRRSSDLASLHDAGSDDLTATWEFGDGTSVRETFWNNGVSPDPSQRDRKSTRLNSSHLVISYAVFCLKKKKKKIVKLVTCKKKYENCIDK